MKKSNLEATLKDVRNGIPVVIVDDSDREDEADIVIAAEKANKENIIFAVNNAKGLMCLPCNGERLERLKIPMMPTNNLDTLQTPFSVSIDAVEGTTTGMSVSDRLKTISVFLDENSRPEELSQPGHLFPLKARPGLLKERRGHTESSIALMRLAGMKEVAVIIEIMNKDCTMCKGKDLKKFVKKHKLRIVSIQEIHDELYK